MEKKSAPTLVVGESNSLTVRNIPEWRQKFLSLFQNVDPAVLHIDDRADIDICGLQLIHSARRLAESSSKSLSLAAPASGKLLQALLCGGLLEDASAADRAFWLHEGVR